MANQTAQREPRYQPNLQKDLLSDQAIFYRGGLVAFDGTVQYVKKAVAGLGVNARIAGVVRSMVDNTVGAAGTKRVEVWRAGTFWFALSGSAVFPGASVYAVDDQTVTGTAGTSFLVGTVEENETVNGVAGVKVRISVV